MSISFRFIADPSEPSHVLAWFRSVNPAPVEVPTDYGYVLYFKSFGPLAHLPDGSIDAKSSPVVTIVLPQVRRGVLWTVGEVDFRSTPLQKQFPVLYKIKSAFSEWLSSLECVYSLNQREGSYSYYLEGSVRNHDASIFAFESGLQALKSERYFIGHQDNQFRLDKLCKTLRLRGIECAGA
jgi:hypothetical protein